MEHLGTFTPDNLLAGDFPIVTGEVTIATGQNIPRGTILGKVTATGKYILHDKAAVDGSENPVKILLEDVDANAADVKAIAALTGEFNENRITMGGATVVDDVRDALRGLSIYLKQPSN